MFGFPFSIINISHIKVRYKKKIFLSLIRQDKFYLTLPKLWFRYSGKFTFSQDFRYNSNQIKKWLCCIWKGKRSYSFRKRWLNLCASKWTSSDLWSSGWTRAIRSTADRKSQWNGWVEKYLPLPLKKQKRWIFRTEGSIQWGRNRCKFFCQSQDVWLSRCCIQIRILFSSMNNLLE